MTRNTKIVKSVNICPTQPRIVPGLGGVSTALLDRGTPHQRSRAAPLTRAARATYRCARLAPTRCAHLQGACARTPTPSRCRATGGYGSAVQVIRAGANGLAHRRDPPLPQRCLSGCMQLAVPTPRPGRQPGTRRKVCCWARRGRCPQRPGWARAHALCGVKTMGSTVRLHMRDPPSRARQPMRWRRGEGTRCRHRWIGCRTPGLSGPSTHWRCRSALDVQ